jgi:hypothetical protein
MRGENFDLVLSLIDSDAAGTSSPYYIGAARINTAALYFEALRDASSSLLERSGDVGRSSVVSSSISFADAGGNEVGTAEVGVYFQVESVQIPTSNTHEGSSYGTNNDDGDDDNDKEKDPLEQARMELQLKQTFTLADADGSGDVDLMEMTEIVEKARDPRRGAALGLGDGVLELLTALVGFGSSADEDNDDDESVAAAVGKIFSQIDIDGRGGISWWEWQVFLGQALRSGGQKEVVLDPIAISLQAAAAALGNDGRCGEDARAGEAGMDDDDDDDLGGIEDDRLAQGSMLSDIAGLKPARAVSRLQDLVKSLRSENSGLMSRLEQAIVDSHALTTAPKAGGSEPVVGETKAYKKEAETLASKLRASQDEALRWQGLFEAEGNRSSMLQQELSRAFKSGEDALASERVLAARESQSALRSVAARHHDRLARKKAEIIKRKHSLLVLTSFFKALGARARQRLLDRRASEKLTGDSVVAIQARARGVLSRQHQRKRQTAIVRMQSLARGRAVRRDYVHFIEVTDDEAEEEEEEEGEEGTETGTEELGAEAGGEEAATDTATETSTEKGADRELASEPKPGPEPKSPLKSPVTSPVQKHVDTSAKDLLPTKAPVKEPSPVKEREFFLDRVDGHLAKASSPRKEPVKEASPMKDPSPRKEVAKAPSPRKEPVKEASPVRTSSPMKLSLPAAEEPPLVSSVREEGTAPETAADAVGREFFLDRGDGQVVDGVVAGVKGKILIIQLMVHGVFTANEECLPFETDGLSWKKVIAHSPTRAVSSAAHKYTTKPERIEDSVGFAVEFMEDATEGGEMPEVHLGHIVGFDARTKLLQLKFDDDDDDDNEVDQIAFSTPNLRWLVENRAMPAVSPTPTP